MPPCPCNLCTTFLSTMLYQAIPVFEKKNYKNKSNLIVPTRKYPQAKLSPAEMVE